LRLKLPYHTSPLRTQSILETDSRSHQHSTEEQQTLTHTAHTESQAIKSIRTKLKDNGAMITCADKGNSVVILLTTQYESKKEEFVQTNNFQISMVNPTKSFQSQVRKVINNSKTLIPSETKWKHTNMNPTAPSIKGLIKLHKPEHPVRPVVNW
jgi:uncharacterized UBP type Zn finger protein